MKTKKAKQPRIVRTLDESGKKREELETLIRELDIEMDGVRCPASAAAILNRLRRLVKENK